jgi:Flp pilus assembly protein TadD
MLEAEKAYKTAIDLRPNDWASYNLLGAFYYSQSCYPEAEPYFRKVEQLTPENHMAYTNLGAVYLSLGRHAEATAMFQKSLALNPEVARPYSNLGMVCEFEGRYAEAATWHEKAIGHAPADDRYWGNLGHAQRWDPNLAAKAPATFRRAIDLGEQAVNTNPRDATLHARLATYWAAIGERTKGLSAIARALAIAPTSGYVQFRAALVYEQAGDRKRALRALQSALEFTYPLEEIKNSPPLKNLREDPRYRKLLETRASRAQTTCSLQH